MQVRVPRPMPSRPSVWNRRLGLGALLTLVVFVAGCGFHLQGSNPLPDGVDRMAVTYHDNYTVGDPELVTALKERLRRQHLLGSDGAPAQLDIVSVKKNQRTVAVSPIDGDSVVRELTVRVIYNYSVNGQNVLTGESLSTSRDFASDETQQLSTDDERRHLLVQMQDDLANQILERLAQQARHTGAGAAGTGTGTSTRTETAG